MGWKPSLTSTRRLASAFWFARARNPSFSAIVLSRFPSRICFWVALRRAARESGSDRQRHAKNIKIRGFPAKVEELSTSSELAKVIDVLGDEGLELGPALIGLSCRGKTYDQLGIA